MNCDSTTKFYDVSNAVAQKLHCVVCSGQNIASSDAIFAVNVRSDICQYAHDGLSEGQIIAKITADYGADIKVATLESSEMMGLNITLFALLLAGMFIIKSVAKR